MKYPAYPKYKDSGVEWLGEVPDGWKTVAVRRLSRMNPSKSEIPLPPDATVAFLPMELAGTDGTFEFHIVQLYKVYSGYTYFRDGDILIAKITPCFENGKGALAHGLPNGVGFGSTEFHVVRVEKKIFPKFLFHIFTQEIFRSFGESEMIGAAGQKRVPEQFISNFCFSLPALTEQQAIAAFLDAETAKIDAVIAEQEKLISLLQEKRQAVISHAVTKGLNPDAPMKDSGVEWLGEVPEGWTLSKIKRLCFLYYGIGEPPEYQPEGVPLIRATNVKSGKIVNENLAFVDPKDIPAQRIVWLESGDIIVVRSGAYTGDTAIITDEYSGSIAGFDMVLKNYSIINSKYILYCLLSSGVKKFQIDSKSIRSAQPHLNAIELGECIIVLSSIIEQQAIVTYLDHETAKIDATIAEANKAIELLKERRSAVVSAAVTGKIDVRATPLQEAV